MSVLQDFDITYAFSPAFSCSHYWKTGKTHLYIINVYTLCEWIETSSLAMYHNVFCIYHTGMKASFLEASIMVLVYLQGVMV